MNNFLYSPKANAFFPYSLEKDYRDAGSWPDDGIGVDDVVFLEFQTPQPGKMRVAGENGLPSWADIPPPTMDESIASADQKKISLRSVADSEIAWLQDAVDAGIATEDEIIKLSEWKKYRVLLMRIDTSTYPYIEWPPVPE